MPYLPTPRPVPSHRCVTPKLSCISRLRMAHAPKLAGEARQDAGIHVDPEEPMLDLGEVEGGQQCIPDLDDEQHVGGSRVSGPVAVGANSVVGPDRFRFPGRARTAGHRPKTRATTFRVDVNPSP